MTVQKSTGTELLTKRFHLSDKRMAVIHHPDKVIGKEAKEKAQARFKLMQEALEVLTDERKRQWYDEGHDCTSSPQPFFFNLTD